MTIPRDILIQRVRDWQKAHPPVTGYAESAIRAVCAADLPVGTNLMLQFGLQFTGREETVDEVHWDKPEWRLPYSNTYRYSLDRSVDCSSFWYVLHKIFAQVDIGTWSEAQWRNLKSKQVPWSDRRPGYLVFFNFKADRTVSHVAGYIGDGLILHTTSPTNPLRVEADSYAASKRVGVVRPLSDAQYQTLLVDAAWRLGRPEGVDMIVLHDPRTDAVRLLQTMLVGLGYDLGTYGPAGDGVDGDYGSKTRDAVAKFQADAKVQTANVGLADDVTLLALAEAYALRASVLGEAQKQVTLLRSVLSQIATLAQSV